MWFHLRLAALVSILWVLILALRPLAGAVELVGLLPSWAVVVAALVHLGLAALFWWGSSDPPHRLRAIYVALAVFTLRSVGGVYLVLYVLPRDAAMVWLVEMVLSIGLISALINALPHTVKASRAE